MIQPTNHMELKKKENQSMDASILHRRGSKIITRDRRSEGSGRERGGGGKKVGDRIRCERSQGEVQRPRKLNEGVKQWGIWSWE